MTSDGLLYRISIIQDMSEKKRAELLQEQLQQSQKLEAVGQLAAGIAHDFNTLLSIVLGYAELLTSELLREDPRRQDAEQIEGAAQYSLYHRKRRHQRRNGLNSMRAGAHDYVLKDNLVRLTSGSRAVSISSNLKPCAGQRMAPCWMWPSRFPPYGIRQETIFTTKESADSGWAGGTLGSCSCCCFSHPTHYLLVHLGPTQQIPMIHVVSNPLPRRRK